ncbi:hypothetical protein ACC703_39525, partial [Rhizobium ruizarguesonis]
QSFLREQTAGKVTDACQLHQLPRFLVTGEKKRKILFVTGEYNSGKSRLVENILAADPALLSYKDDEGRAQPLLKDDAAS